ncbi:TSUP family transporter [Legionella sp. 29fVS95]|uniref:TSUP family transporter n=1 Tax=Legionella sp. 29fVS95 TaxID=3402813 RepID=UPI003AF9B92D
MIVIYLFVGVFTGLLAMLFGFGGGFVVVPILFWLLPLHGVAIDLAMHVAIGTSLMLMLINMVYTTALHFRSQNLDIPLLKQMLPLLILGAIFGASTASMIDSQQ